MGEGCSRHLHPKVYIEKGKKLKIRPRLFRTVWPLLSEYPPNHSSNLALCEEVIPSGRNEAMASASNSWPRSEANPSTVFSRLEQRLKLGFDFGFELEPGFQLIRLSWTCRETTRLSESLTLAMPSIVACKSLGVSSAPK